MSAPLDPYSEEAVAAKGWDTALLSRLLVFARPHRALFLQSFAVLVLLFGSELAGPWILREAIDGPVASYLEAREPGAAALEHVAASLQRALPGAPGELAGRALRALPPPAAAERDEAVRALALWALAFLGVVLATAGLRFLEVAQLARTGQRVIHDLRTALFAHVGRLELAWFERRPTGSLVTRVTSDVENLNEMFTSGLVVLLFDLVKIAVLLAILFWVQPDLALVVLALLPVLIGVSVFFRGGARRRGRRR